MGVPNRALYAATKGALCSLTLALAAEHVHEGIRVNAVAPGTADTPWIGRLVTAEEVAHAIVSLASPLSGSTTGIVLGVNGGMSTLRLPR